MGCGLGQHVGAAPAAAWPGCPARERAAAQAYAMAGVGPRDIQVAEVHDCFTIAEIMAYEDLGFCAKGEGGPFIAERRSYIGGTVAVNVDGGLKAKGHPIGATGRVDDLRDRRASCAASAASGRCPGAGVGLTHNVGGIGQYCFVQVLTRE